jgi:bifunctional oligoribonuclease and PAP phosphatase NrnA
VWQEVIPLIENNQTFILTSHMNPDGDALGSELALAEHLIRLGKKVHILNSDAMPPVYRFLDTRKRIKRYSGSKHSRITRNADVIIVLDASGGWKRLGPIGDTLEITHAVKLCIDHHPDAAAFVDLAVVDTNMASTAELIYSLITTMGGVISLEMAQALYVAILTDTGSFRFPKTSPQTHLVASALLAAGADPLYLYRQIYEQASLGYVRLKGRVMDSIQTAGRGQIAYYSLTAAMLKSYGVKAAELDGFASLGQGVKGVRISIFCQEVTQNRIKISLRSDGSVAINQIAVAYGGGGHPSAAGALVTGELNQVMAELVQKVETLFNTS